MLFRVTKDSPFMKLRLYKKVVLSLILSLFLIPPIISAQKVHFLGVATPNGVYLRWKIPKKYRNNPLYIYRKRADRNKSKPLTLYPLLKARNSSEIKKIVGDDWDYIIGKKKLPGVDKVPKNKSKKRLTWQEKEKDIMNKFFNDTTYLDIVSLFYPKLARALNTYYFDPKPAKNTQYTYILVLGSNKSKKKKKLKSIQVNTGNIPSVDPPTNVVGSPRDKKSLIEWKPISMSSGVLGYNVYRNTNKTGEFIKVNKKPIFYVPTSSGKKKKAMKKPVVNYLDKVKDTQQTYWYYIKSVHFAGMESKPSKKVNIKPLVGNKPKPVTVIKATLAKTGKITVRWQPSKNKTVNYYNLYRSLTDKGVYKKVNRLPIPSNVSTYEDTLQDVGINYYYKLKSFTIDNIGSDFSATMTCKILRKTKPVRVKLISAKSRGGKMIIRWLPSKEKYTKSYEIYRAQNRNRKPTIIGKVKSKVTSFVDKDAFEGVTYYYTVRVRDKWYKQSPASNIITARLKDTKPPIAPAGFHAIVKENFVKLRWKPVFSYNLRGFIIYRRTEKNRRLRRINKKLIPLKTNEFPEVIRREWGKIEYFITAVSIGNTETKKLGPVVVRAWIGEPLPAPKKLLVYQKKGKVFVRWQKIYHKDLIGYNVFRKKVLELKFKRLNRKLISKSKTFFVDSTIKVGESYQYYVIGIDRYKSNGKMPTILNYKVNKD